MVYGIEYLALILILTVVCMLLKRWEPPIKEQYVVLLLMSVGVVLAIYMSITWFWGMVFAGLVFWKDDYVEETKVILQSYKRLTINKDEVTHQENCNHGSRTLKSSLSRGKKNQMK